MYGTSMLRQTSTKYFLVTFGADFSFCETSIERVFLCDLCPEGFVRTAKEKV